MIAVKPPLSKSRSNRPLTQWACFNVLSFLQGEYQESCKRSQGNTTFLVEVEGRVQKCGVYLFDNLILSIILDDWKPVSVQVAFGNYWDGHGQPTNTTAERLNGLLDTLGAHGVIPEGVRVFRGSEHKITYLGKGDDYTSVGQSFGHLVYIKPNANELEIVGKMLVHDVEEEVEE